MESSPLKQLGINGIGMIIMILIITKNPWELSRYQALCLTRKDLRYLLMNEWVRKLKVRAVKWLAPSHALRECLVDTRLDPRYPACWSALYLLCQTFWVVHLVLWGSSCGTVQWSGGTFLGSCCGSHRLSSLGGPHERLGHSLYLQVCLPGPARERDLSKVKQTGFVCLYWSSSTWNTAVYRSIYFFIRQAGKWSKPFYESKWAWFLILHSHWYF